MSYIGNSPANVGNYQVVDDISASFNGTTTSFALTASSQAITPAKSGQLLVSINGVLQEPDDTGTDGFKVSSSNIVFSSAPATGSTFWCVYQGQNVDIGTPSDGTVGTAQLVTSGLELKHSGSTKLSTTSTGIDVTGTVTADGLTVDGAIALTDSGLSNRNVIYLDGSDNLVLATGTTSGFRGIHLYTNNNKSLSVNEGGDISFYEDTGTTPKFFWDASAESLKIGGPQTTGVFPLTVKSNSNNHAIQLEEANGGEGYTIGVDADGDLGFYNSGGPTASMTLDDSGNVLVGHTSITNYANTVGSSMRASGFSTHTTDGNAALLLNRLTSDGDIVQFRKDNSTVGSIGAKLGDTYFANDDGHGIRLRAGSAEVRPCTSTGTDNDASIDLGSSGVRFKDLYLSGGVYLGGTGTANALDDYEEGTFTPYYYSSGGGETVTHDIQQGRYTKVGDLVTIHILVGTDAISGGSSNCRIGGLPFTSSQTTSTSVGLGYAFLSTAPRRVVATAGLSSLQLYPTHGSSVQLPWASLNTGGNDNRIYITMSYWAT